DLAAPFDVELEVALSPESRLAIDVGGAPLVVDAQAGEVRLAELVAPLPSRDGPVTLRILVDRGSIELFVDSGRLAFSKSWQYGRESVAVTLEATGDVRLERGEVRRL